MTLIKKLVRSKNVVSFEPFQLRGKVRCYAFTVMKADTIIYKGNTSMPLERLDTYAPPFAKECTIAREKRQCQS